MNKIAYCFFIFLLTAAFVILLEGCSSNRRLVKIIEKDYNTNFILFSDTATSLSLREKRLSKIPKVVFQCRNLEFLDLSVNKLKSIPSEIEVFKKLKVLVVSYCHIKTLPQSISNLRELQYLSLLDNNIEYIPSEISKLNKLKVLNLNANPVRKLPTTIFSMSRLEKLNLGQWNGDTLLNRPQLDSLFKLMPDCKVTF
jgi:Leucine-rich repeat (LRR) protein